MLAAVRQKIHLCYRPELRGQLYAIRSSGEVNDLIGRLFGEALPAVYFSHGHPARRHQSPEQHGGCFGAGQHGLRFDPSLELFVKAFDRIRRSFRAALKRANARLTLFSKLRKSTIALNLRNCS